MIWVYTIFAHFHTIPAVYTIFAYFHTITSLYLLYIFSWTITGAAEILYFRHGYKTLQISQK